MRARVLLTATPQSPLALLIMLLLTRGLFADPLPDMTSQEVSSLEAASLEEGDHAADPEPPEGCCVRGPKMESLHDGEGGSVDVGHCSRSCRHGIDSDFNTSDEVAENGGAAQCPGTWQCDTARVALRRETTADGRVRELRVVEGCACRLRVSPCARRPLALRLYPDTPFDTSIDVGTCSGHCRHGGGCRAVHKRSVAVTGPNGAQCVPVVERCECSASCYRVRRLEVIHDYAGDGGALLTHPIVKEVDVGACEGACEPSAPARRCADPFWRAGTPCRSWLYESRGRGRVHNACTAANTSTRRYTARDGERRRLVVVESCGCK